MKDTNPTIPSLSELSTNHQLAKNISLEAFDNSSVLNKEEIELMKSVAKEFTNHDLEKTKNLDSKDFISVK